MPLVLKKTPVVLSSPTAEVTEPRPEILERIGAAITLHEVDHGVVTAYSSTFELGHDLVVDRSGLSGSDRVCYETDYSETIGPRLSLRVARRTTKIADGVFLGGNGSFNWYHFLVEIIPKLLYLPPEFEKLPLLVPPAVRKFPQFLELLELVRPGARVVTLEESVAYEVDHLVWISQPTTTPFNLVPGVWPEWRESAIDRQSLSALRDTVLRELRPPAGGDERRVFLARESSNRTYNQDEVRAVVESHGFEACSPGNLAFLDQVRMFQDASLVVGPTGAAWSNVIFARAGLRGLYWVSKQSREFSLWTGLASIPGADLRYITYDSEATSTSAVYSAPYRLDLDSLDAAISHLVRM